MMMCINSHHPKQKKTLDELIRVDAMKNEALDFLKSLSIIIRVQRIFLSAMAFQIEFYFFHIIFHKTSSVLVF
jgi:hypothetical protein